MMLTIAEGYETEVYGKHHYINDLQNYVLASTKIWWKYNSGIGDLLLNSLQNNWGYLGDLQYDIIALALGEIDDIVVVQPLLNAMNDTDSEVKKEARLSLIKLSSQSSEIESMLPF